MKKNNLLRVVLVAPVVVILACFVPVIKTRELIIAAPETDVAAQLNNPANWKKWNPNIKKAFAKEPGKCSIASDYQTHYFTIATPNYSVAVSNAVSNRFIITDKTGTCNIVLAENNQSRKTNLTVESKQAIFSWLFRKQKEQEDSNDMSRSIKKFMETDSLYYGFPIAIKKVADSIVVALNKHIPSREKFIAPVLMFNRLQTFVSDNHLTITQPLMLAYTESPNDSLNVFTMYAVNKKVDNKDGIRCMKMPAGGRMLVGYFEGKYKDRIQLKIAMERYMLDKNITGIVSSYEKMTDNTLPRNEDDTVTLEIYYPIL